MSPKARLLRVTAAMLDVATRSHQAAVEATIRAEAATDAVAVSVLQTWRDMGIIDDADELVGSSTARCTTTKKGTS